MQSYDDDFGKTTQRMSKSNITHHNMHSRLIRLAGKPFFAHPLACHVLNDMLLLPTNNVYEGHLQSPYTCGNDAYISTQEIDSCRLVMYMERRCQLD